MHGVALDTPSLSAIACRCCLACSVSSDGPRAGQEDEKSSPGDGPWQLRFGGERHQEESEGEGDDAPDGATPLGGRLPLASCMPSMTVNTADMRVHDPLLATRDTPLLFVSSTVEEAERQVSAAPGSGSDGGAYAVRRRLPGKGTGSPAPSPQTRTCAMNASGSSGASSLRQWRTTQATPRLAHNCADPGPARCCGGSWVAAAAVADRGNPQTSASVGGPCGCAGCANRAKPAR